MSVDLPKPASIRAREKQHLRVLLDARLNLPALVERLSRGFMHIDADTAIRWAGWTESLMQDPGWEVVEPVLQMPEAWPDAWHRARQAGFSEPTEHHQAIFFTRLFERAVHEERFELARYAFSEALESWSRLSDGDYLREQVLQPAGGRWSDAQIEEALSRLLDGPMALLRSLGMRALRTDSWDAPPARRPLRFALEATRQVTDTFQNQQGPIASGLLDRAETLVRQLHHRVMEAVEHRLETVDYATAQLDEFLAVIDGALTRGRQLEFPPELDRALLRRGLDLIWELRDTGRDDELGIIPPMVERLEPCTERLREAGGDDFFGLEGAVADLLVFAGEEALSLDAREQAYEQALEICPGHRNASRLLSYVLLERANRDLLKTAALPDASARVNAIRQRIRPLVERAAGRISRAEQLYPDNELLDEYRSDLQNEIDRFKLAPEPTDEH